MSEQTNIVRKVAFQKTRGYEKRPGVKGLYIDRRTGKRVYRTKQITGVDNWFTLDARTDKAAEEEIRAKFIDHKRAKLKIDNTVDPFARNQNLPFRNIVAMFIAAGCPTRKHLPRVGKSLEEYKSYLTLLTKAFGSKPWDHIDNDGLRAFHAQITAEIQSKYKVDADSAGLRRSGDRTVELAFDALTSLYKWGRQFPSRTGITHIPFDRIRYRVGAKIRHSRECQPRDGDEVDEYCAALDADSHSEVLAWQMQFQWFTGQRTHELLRLRVDGSNSDTPGFIDLKKNRLWFYRSPTHKGTDLFWKLTPTFRSFLEAHRLWHQRRYPNSPLMFPNLRDPSRAADKNALTKALARECEIRDRRDQNGKRRNITAHGIRSGHASYLWNEVTADGTPKYESAYVAARLGQKSDRNLVECYGERGDPISLHPTVRPWWHRWLPHGEHHWTEEKARDFIRRIAGARIEDLRGKETLF